MYLLFNTFYNQKSIRIQLLTTVNTILNNINNLVLHLH